MEKTVEVLNRRPLKFTLGNYGSNANLMMFGRNTYRLSRINIKKYLTWLEKIVETKPEKWISIALDDMTSGETHYISCSYHNNLFLFESDGFVALDETDCNKIINNIKDFLFGEKE